MRKVIWLASAMGASALLVSAGADSRTTPSLSELAGEYRSPHEIEIQRGPGNHEVNKVEDVLRIIKLSRSRAYVTFDMQFVNGHSCEFYGISDYRDGTFVHRSKTLMMDQDDADGECVLHIEVENGGLTLHDERGTCRRNSCSARGYIEGQRFELSRRRPITDVESLLKGGYYERAVKDYEKR
jgi:hypothetical protein